jgi:predicted TIM-barrel fold metal-dependent hydrolase
MGFIDAHAHYVGDHADTLDWLKREDLKLLNICVAHIPGDGWRKQADLFQTLSAEFPQHYAWCTAIDVPRFDDSEYVERAIEGLKQDFEHGAVACKVWKNIGMEVRNPDGEAVLIDDPIFEPIFDCIAESDRTLLMHMAEPLACWLPLDENNTHRGYYTQNPQWHMYGRDDLPHHRDIMAARDHVVERHPNLRVVGAHLASLEYDVDEMARRFDRYSNFAVDTSGPGRIVDLAQQDREVVRQFFIEYQDRLMYGSDTVSRSSQLAMSDQDRQKSFERFRGSYEIGREYYCTDRKFVVKGHSVHGLNLPVEVQEKLFYNNAQEWYPGF